MKPDSTVGVATKRRNKNKTKATLTADAGPCPRLLAAAWPPCVTALSSVSFLRPFVAGSIADSRMKKPAKHFPETDLSLFAID